MTNPEQFFNDLKGLFRKHDVAELSSDENRRNAYVKYNKTKDELRVRGMFLQGNFDVDGFSKRIIESGGSVTES